MTATGHAIIGTVIAVKIANPAIALPLAIASHVFADMFPHWDSGTNGRSKSQKRLITEATIDVLVGFALAFIVAKTLFPHVSLLYIFIVIIASQLLDWLSAPYYFFHIKWAPIVWMYKLQKNFNGKLDKPWGIINQVVVLFLLVLLAKVF